MINVMRGVVENNVDPLAMSRVRVRILGFHSDKKADVPTLSLPLCEVVQGTAGTGAGAVIKVGTWVWLFFEDGDWTRPVVFGTMIGNLASPPTDGFVPDNAAPLTPAEQLAEDRKTPEQKEIERKIKERKARVGEPDLHPFTRAETSTMVNEVPAQKAKLDSLITAVPTSGGSSWAEFPESSSKSKYPHNIVTETPSGHIIELDSTEGNERIQILHRTGTYIEIRPDGDITVKTQKDSYKITQGDEYEYTAGKKSETIGGTKEEKVTGDVTVEYEAKLTERIVGAVMQQLTDAFTMQAGGPITMTSGASVSVVASGGMTLDGGGIKIGAGASNPIPLGNVLKDWLANHTHINGTGTPAQAGALSGILSAKSTVE